VWEELRAEYRKGFEELFAKMRDHADRLDALESALAGKGQAAVSDGGKLADQAPPA